ncbi:MAG: ABC transporter ATP-binding protein [candidate division WOR-3 bacterium]
MPLIDARGIHKIFMLGKVELHVLRGIDLAVERGEYISIMGPSGSGKSTLMHILGCLETPTSGTYILDGQEVHGLDEPELASIRRTKIGFVFQNFYLLPRISALDNVALPMVYTGVPLAERRKRAGAILERVGLGDRVKHNPSELSGGERQRVAIGRALANNPEIIFADEPTGNLDTKNGGEIMDLFAELHRGGKTIILVTHDLEIAKRAERIVRLRDGRVEG